MSVELAETAAPAVSAMLVYLLMAVVLVLAPAGALPAEASMSVSPPAARRPGAASGAPRGVRGRVLRLGFEAVLLVVLVLRAAAAAVSGRAVLDGRVHAPGDPRHRRDRAVAAARRGGSRELRARGLRRHRRVRGRHPRLPLDLRRGGRHRRQLRVVAPGHRAGHERRVRARDRCHRAAHPGRALHHDHDGVQPDDPLRAGVARDLRRRRRAVRRRRVGVRLRLARGSAEPVRALPRFAGFRAVRRAPHDARALRARAGRGLAERGAQRHARDRSVPLPARGLRGGGSDRAATRGS